MAQVILDQLDKTFAGNIKAVSNLSLSVRDKEFLVIVGPSGCGKSTTLRMIAGLESISGGTVRIGDRVVNNVPPKQRDTVMVFQSPALYPQMTVYRNIAFGLKLRRLAKPEIDRRVRWAAKMLGLSDLLQRKPRELSGGQRQRVALGRALVRRPQVFLFDEPLAGLDAQRRLEVRADLKRLHRELKRTTIHVTHEQEEAMTLGQRVAVMDHGFIHQCDTPLQLYHHPANQFVAAFLGLPPMNFLQGRLRREGDRMYFISPAVRVMLTDQQTRSAMSYVGQEVQLGIRPQALYPRVVPGIAENPLQQISGTVDFVEPLGFQMNLYASTLAGEQLVSRTDMKTFHAGDRIQLFINMDLVHLFEPNRHEDDRKARSKYGQTITRSPS